MALLSIDPGLHHGFAVLEGGGGLLLASEFPLLGEGANKRLGLGKIKDLVNQYGINVAVVEDVSAFPKQGISSSFRFGRAAGQVEGAMMGLGIALHFVRPNIWKKIYGERGRTGEGMRALAAQRWPKHQGSFERVKDEHRAAAAMMGAYWLQNGGQR